MWQVDVFFLSVVSSPVLVPKKMELTRENLNALLGSGSFKQKTSSTLSRGSAQTSGGRGTGNRDDLDSECKGGMFSSSSSVFWFRALKYCLINTFLSGERSVAEIIKYVYYKTKAGLVGCTEGIIMLTDILHMLENKWAKESKLRGDM